MINWNTYRLWLGSEWVSAPNSLGLAPVIDSFSTDSRSIRKGDWFVPISGANYDGHDFIDEVMRKGAAGFFYARAKSSELSLNQRSLGLEVNDPLTALQRIARGWRLELNNLKLLAMTGSSGKTTTKEMLGSIIKSAGCALTTEGSFNNEIGVPKTLLMLKPEHRYAAVEMGARHRGNISFLCQIANPNVVGLLNVGSAHLGEFGSQENLLRTKLEIFMDSPRSATLVANADDEKILAGGKATGKALISFGRSPQADVSLLSEQWLPSGGMRIELGSPLGKLQTTIKTAHAVYGINAAAATAMAIAAGVSVPSIISGLEAFSGIKGRYQVHKLKSLTLVDDTYNANPDSMKSGLETIGRSYKSNRIVLVLGDMLELGPEAESLHRKIGHLAASLAHPSRLITIGKLGEIIAEGAMQSDFLEKNIEKYPSVDALLEAGLDFASLGDVVYAKASNGLKLSKLVDHLVARYG